MMSAIALLHSALHTCRNEDLKEKVRIDQLTDAGASQEDIDKERSLLVVSYSNSLGHIILV